jgi:hypothetical protein
MRGLRLFKQLLCFRQIRLHFFVVSGKDFVGINPEGAAASGHRLGHEFGALGAHSPDSDCLFANILHHLPSSAGLLPQSAQYCAYCAQESFCRLP